MLIPIFVPLDKDESEKYHEVVGEMGCWAYILIASVFTGGAIISLILLGVEKIFHTNIPLVWDMPMNGAINFILNWEYATAIISLGLVFGSTIVLFLYCIIGLLIKSFRKKTSD